MGSGGRGIGGIGGIGRGAAGRSSLGTAGLGTASRTVQLLPVSNVDVDVARHPPRAQPKSMRAAPPGAVLAGPDHVVPPLRPRREGRHVLLALQLQGEGEIGRHGILLLGGVGAVGVVVVVVVVDGGRLVKEADGAAAAGLLWFVGRDRSEEDGRRHVLVLLLRIRRWHGSSGRNYST